MPRSIYSPLGDVALFVDAAAHHAELRASLDAAGYTAAHHAGGQRLVESALVTFNEVQEDTLNDTTLIHLVHSAATEVEMWTQASRRRTRKGLDDNAALDRIFGADIHLEDHTLSVVAQAKRALATLTVDSELKLALGNPRTAADMYQRGYVLLRKLLDLADALVANEEQYNVRLQIPPVADSLNRWLTDSHAIAARALTASPVQLGTVGWVPDSVASLGGTSGAVTRHGQARHAAPSLGADDPAPGWSLGRQGRNGLNHGAGYR